MDRLNCYVCNQIVGNGLDGLVNHLKFNHGLTINRGYGQSGFQCGQEGCQRRFTLFDSMRKHIKRHHLNERNIEEPLQHADVPRDAAEHNNPEPMNAEPENEINDGMVEIPHHEELFRPQLHNLNRNINEEYANCNIRLSIVRMVSRLHTKSSVTGTLVNEVIDEFEEVFLDTVNFFKYHVEKFVEQANMIDDERAKELLQKFEFDCSPFENLSSLPQQIEALKDNCGYIDAREEPLGYRIDDVFDSESGTYIQRRVDETYQYIPIIDVLTTVLSNGEVREAILSEEPSEEGVLTSFIDGEWFKSHRFFQLQKYALRLILYYDDLEIVGGLGSKTGPHKLGVFYYIIDNIPEHQKSKLGEIHVLCLCYSTDVKKYGFHHILERFMEDLQRLESDEGVLIKIEAQDFTLRASIAAFCGDGLAVHEVFGLLGPSATRFCRLCLITREDLLEGNVEPSEERTERVFADHLQTVRTAGPTALAIRNAASLTGLRDECPLNASKYFHIARNKIFNIMHDVLLGTGPMCLKLVLNNFIFVRRLFTVDYLNGQISAFQYGLMERKNKPSSNFTAANLRNIEDNSLSQKAMQMWCLLRVFPFLVAGKIPKEDEHMNLILLLLRIMEIIFAPKLTKSIMPYLRALIMEFINHFKELFPNKNLINKFHHMAHYPDCITWSGPLVKLWCMGFERKHGPMKQRAQIVNNFKNSPKTLIRIYQSVQSAMWGAGDLKVYSVKSQGGKNTPVEFTISEGELRGLGYFDNDIVFKTKSVRVNGAKYSIGSFVCLDAKQQNDINLLLFGKISEIIIVPESQVYLRTMTYITKHLDVDLNAFCIQCEDEHNSDVKFLSTEELAHYRPFSAWTLSTTNELFISLRHILL